MQVILSRVHKEASRSGICSTSSNNAQRVLGYLPSSEEASVRRMTRILGLGSWCEDSTILDCSSSFSTLPLTSPLSNPMKREADSSNLGPIKVEIAR